MVGGYPEGRDWDLRRDGEVSDAEMRAAIKRIMSQPIPRLDPVTGDAMHNWRDAPIEKLHEPGQFMVVLDDSGKGADRVARS
jgi:hypothetical protein